MYGSKLRVRGIHALETAIIAPHYTEKAPAASFVETRQIGYQIQRIAIRFASLAAFFVMPTPCRVRPAYARLHSRMICRVFNPIIARLHTHLQLSCRFFDEMQTRRRSENKKQGRDRASLPASL